MTEPTKTATFRDRTGWASGPWDTEPDRAEWRMPELPGYACLVLRNHMGAWCGYVGVPPGHPAHGKDYDAIDSQLEVHGGVTFSSACAEGDGPDKICHVPLPGESDAVWWIGFDCGHAFDVSPGLDAQLRSLPGTSVAREALLEVRARDHGDVYRTLGYVWGEVESLARQLAALAPTGTGGP